MSTRVRKYLHILVRCYFHELWTAEKGGPIFRPVAKPRGRSVTAPNVPRQSSVAADPRCSVTPGGTIDILTPASMAMPPPAAIPSTVRSVSHGPHVIRTSRPPSVPSIQASNSADCQAAHVSNLSSSHPATTEDTVISAPARNVPVPVSPGQSRSFPIAITGPSTASASTILQSTTAVPPLVLPEYSQPPSGLTFNQILMGPPPIQFHGFSFDHQSNSFVADNLTAPPAASELPQGSGSPGLPRLAVNTDSVVKVPQTQRKSGRKKKAEAAEGDPPPTADSGTIKKIRKSARSKKSQNIEGVSINGTEAQSSDPVQNGERTDSMGPVVGPPGTKRKRRSSTAPHRPRKSRGPSHPPFDPDADPGEELDPTVITMAALCSDTGQGRISSKAVQIQSNHAAWKASNREKRARMKMMMESKKFGKVGVEEVVTGEQVVHAPPEENGVSRGPPNQSASGSVRAPSAGPVPEDETGQGFDYSQSMSTSRFNVQVRIGPNGETIIDEESLFVDRVDENETVNYTHVEESDTTKFVNSSTYGRKFRGSRWSGEETELFFDVSMLPVMCCVCSDTLHRHSPSSARTMNLFLMFYQAAIGKLARINLKPRTEGIQLASLIASTTAFHMVGESVVTHSFWCY